MQIVTTTTGPRLDVPHQGRSVKPRMQCTEVVDFLTWDGWIHDRNGHGNAKHRQTVYDRIETRDHGEPGLEVRPEVRIGRVARTQQIEGVVQQPREQRCDRDFNGLPSDHRIAVLR